MPLPATATKTFRLRSSLTPSGNTDEENVAIVDMVPVRVAFTTAWAKGTLMYMLPRLSRAMLSGRLGGDMVRTRVIPSLACAAGENVTASTPANNIARRKRRLTLMNLPPLFSPTYRRIDGRSIDARSGAIHVRSRRWLCPCPRAGQRSRKARELERRSELIQIERDVRLETIVVVEPGQERGAERVARADRIDHLHLWRFDFDFEAAGGRICTLRSKRNDDQAGARRQGLLGCGCVSQVRV